MVEPREIVLVCPYQRITEALKGIIGSCEPATIVTVISELDGVMQVGREGMSFGKKYDSLRGVDFSGREWDYKQEPDFGKYVERQLHDVSHEMVEEMMAGHHPSLVIDLEQLVGNFGDAIGVYNIIGFDWWCSQNTVPRLTLPAEVKATLMERMETDPYQGCYTETARLNSDELTKAEQDLRMVLGGESQILSLFHYQA